MSAVIQAIQQQLKPKLRGYTIKLDEPATALGGPALVITRARHPQNPQFWISQHRDLITTRWTRADLSAAYYHALPLSDPEYLQELVIAVKWAFRDLGCGVRHE